MKITWLGQAGLLFEIDGLKIMIDPYYPNYDKNTESEDNSVFEDRG